MVKLVINPDFSFLDSYIKSIPELFKDSGEVIYEARNIIKVFEKDSYKINVKYFKKPHIINQFVYSNLRRSKACRSYKYAMRLTEMGFNTPAPIAYLEQKDLFLLKHSLYISIHEEFDGLLRCLQRGTLEQHADLIRQFAHFTADLHSKNVLHIDYSSGNILYKYNDGKYKFYLVDLNRMTFDRPVDMDRACHNFRRLWGSDEMMELFVKEYARKRNFDEKECLHLTFKYRTEFWDRYTAQYPGMAPYHAD